LGSDRGLDASLCLDGAGDTEVTRKALFSCTTF
jgi:hypothetical protein